MTLVLIHPSFEGFAVGVEIVVPVYLPIVVETLVQLAQVLDIRHLLFKGFDVILPLFLSLG